MDRLENLPQQAAAAKVVTTDALKVSPVLAKGADGADGGEGVHL